MADEDARAVKDALLHQETTDRVDSMTDEARVDLHRDLAGWKKAFPNATPAPAPDAKTVATDEEIAAAVARVAAELRRTHRQVDRLERLMMRRYGSSAPYGRHARLLSRIERLERLERGLRAMI